jgi:hypothetical protein
VVAVAASLSASFVIACSSVPDPASTSTTGPIAGGKADGVASSDGCATEVLAEAEGNPIALAADAEAIYWLARVDDRIEVHGRARESRAVLPAIATGWLGVSALAVDADPGGFVYLLSPWATLARSPKRQPALEELLSPGADDWDHGEELVLAHGSLYFTTQETADFWAPTHLMRFALDAGDATEVALSDGDRATQLQADAGRVYFVVEGSGASAVGEVAGAAAAEVTVIQPLEPDVSMRVSGTSLYVARDEGGARLDRIDLGTGTATTLHHGTAGATLLDPQVDGASVYFLEVGTEGDAATATDRLYRAPIAGGGSAQLVAEAPQIGNLLPIDGRLYWTQLWVRDEAERRDGRVLVTTCR